MKHSCSSNSNGDMSERFTLVNFYFIRLVWHDFINLDGIVQPLAVLFKNFQWPFWNPQIYWQLSETEICRSETKCLWPAPLLRTVTWNARKVECWKITAWKAVNFSMHLQQTMHKMLQKKISKLQSATSGVKVLPWLGAMCNSGWGKMEHFQKAIFRFEIQEFISAISTTSYT